MQDSTPLGIANIAKDMPSTGILTTEGRQFYNTNNQQEMEKSSANWSGEPVNYTRKGEHISIENTPLTYTIFLQPNFFMEFLEKKENAFVGSGLAARTNFVYCYGHFPSKTFEKLDQLNHIPQFQERITQGLVNKKRRFEQNNNQKTMLTFSKEAMDSWLLVNSDIELSKFPGNRLGNLPEHAARLMQNITRIAANIHLINERPGNEICLDDLSQAIYLGALFSDTYSRLFTMVDQFISNSIELQTWLNNYYYQTGQYVIAKNYVRQNGPNKLRNKARLDAALNKLIHSKIIIVGLIEGKMHIQLIHQDQLNSYGTTTNLPYLT